MSAKANGKLRRVFVCLNSDCSRRGNESIYAALCDEFGGADDVEVREYICFGNCDNGANVVVHPDRVWFTGLRAGQVSLIAEYLKTGKLPGGHAPAVDEELVNATQEILDLFDTGEDGAAVKAAAK